MAEGWTRRNDQIRNKLAREYSRRETNSVFLFFFGGSPAKEGALPHPSTTFPWPRTSLFVQKVLSCRNKAIVHCRGFLFSTPDCKDRPRVRPAKIKWCGKSEVLARPLHTLADTRILNFTRCVRSIFLQTRLEDSAPQSDLGNIKIQTAKIDLSMYCQCGFSSEDSNSRSATTIARHERAFFFSSLLRGVAIVQWRKKATVAIVQNGLLIGCSLGVACGYFIGGVGLAKLQSNHRSSLQFQICHGLLNLPKSTIAKSYGH